MIHPFHLLYLTMRRDCLDDYEMATLAARGWQIFTA